MNPFTPLKERLLLLRYECALRFRRNGLAPLLRALRIEDRNATVDRIVATGCSVSRYGDGEFAVLGGGSNGFQRPDPQLAARLREVLTTPVEGHMVCIPASLKDRAPFDRSSRLFIAGYLYGRGEGDLVPHLRADRTYGDSLFTRFYISYRDKRPCGAYVERLKRIWAGRDVLIVEGRFSRLGVGNDLFAGCASIRRIVCPEQNAFGCYDRILEATAAQAAGRLVLIALGMTATVLAYDLARRGVQAIDIGHVDVEYEWMRMGARRKCAVPGKIVNEAADGARDLGCADRTYMEQIIERIDG